MRDWRTTAEGRTRRAEAAGRTLLCAAAVLLPLLACGAAPYRPVVNIPIDRYKIMTHPERAQYDKALRLLWAWKFGRAAPEFEKFTLQFEDSAGLSFAMLMRARALHLGNKRNTAIKVYDETLDYFEEDAVVAAPALYFKAMALLKNGDTLKCLAVLRRMVEHKDYRKHPLAAGALRQLADHYWKHNKRDLAVRHWKQVVRDFSRSNGHEANRARGMVAHHYVLSNDFEGYERWRIDKEKAGDPGHLWAVAHETFHAANATFDPHSPRYKGGKHAKRRADMQAAYKYLASRRQLYEKTGRHLDYLGTSIWFARHRLGDAKLVASLLDEMVARVRSKKRGNDRDGECDWVIQRICEYAEVERAFSLLPLISNRDRADRIRLGLLGRQRKWPEYLALLKAIESKGDAATKAWVLWQRVGVYHRHLGKYAEAVKLYHQIGNPPRTLWLIVECYQAQGKTKEALVQLAEIEGSFASDAPRAAWAATTILHRAKNKKMAIAGARRILKVYPKSGEASAAHQLLEGYGIKTGGGVIDED